MGPLGLRGSEKQRPQAPSQSAKGCCTCQLSNRHSRSANWGNGARFVSICNFPVKLALRPLAQHCKRLSPLLAAPAALLLMQGQAKALLIYNIFESGGDVVVQTSGALDLTGATTTRNGTCGSQGVIYSLEAFVCTGSNTVNLSIYDITGPSLFDGYVSAFGASNVSGMSTFIQASISGFAIDPTYLSNTPIVSSATFNTTTLAGLGFTPGLSGLIGTWTINGTRESIQVSLGAPAVAAPAASVPGPLPLFGVAAAFGWSRRLRKRIATSLSTPPQA